MEFQPILKKEGKKVQKFKLLHNRKKLNEIN